MKLLNGIFLTVLIIGAVNWGSIGLFKVDLVATLFGGLGSGLSRIIYTLVGIAGLWAFRFFGRVAADDDVD